MADLIQIRRDTAANWTSTNPILAQGEMGAETDTLNLKIGDGTGVWNSLPYINTSVIPDGTNGQTLRWGTSWEATSALVVDDSGNVGVGTAPNSLTEKLSVLGSHRYGTAVSINNTTTGGISWSINSSGSDSILGSGNLELSVTSQGPKAVLKANGDFTASKFIGDGSLLTNVPGFTQWDDVTGGINYAGGKVGIGTSSPQYKLDVSTDSDDDGLVIHRQDSTLDARANLYFKPKAGDSTEPKAGVFAYAANSSFGVVSQLTFNLNTTADTGIVGPADEKMRLTNTGRLGVGTTDPHFRGHFSTQSNNDGLTIHRESSAADERANLYFKTRAGSPSSPKAGIFSIGNGGSWGLSKAITFNINSTSDDSIVDTTHEKMRIDSSGRVGIGTDSPDVKLSIDVGTTTANTATAAIGLASGGSNANPVYITRVRENISSNVGIGFDVRNNTDGVFEAMRISSTGRVGIGTDSPNGRLGVYEEGSSRMLVLDCDTATTDYKQSMSIKHSGTDMYTITTGPYTTLAGLGTAGTILQGENVLFNTGGANERMRIDSNGDVVIDRTTSLLSARLTVESTNAAGAFYRSTASGGSSVLAVHSDVGGAETRTGYAQADGTWNPASDGTLKENVRAIGYGLDAVMALRPVEFEWVGDDSTNQVGFIAQEVKEVVSESVAYQEDNGLHYMDKAKLVPVLVKAIQEQQSLIAELTARVEQLETQL